MRQEGVGVPPAGVAVTAAATAPATEAAGVVTAAASAALGRPVELAGVPEALPVGFGPGAFGCRLRDVDALLWSAPLVVRVTPGPAEARAEADWHTWAENAGYPAPRLLAAWEGGPYGTVACHPGLEPSVERMAADPASIPTIIGSLGRLHARLHAQPVAGAPGPPTGREAALARLDARLVTAGPLDAGLREQRAWLGAQDPGPPVAVPCHGGFTPVNLYVDRSDPASAVVTGWFEATLADREYDVANSELGLWASPYLTPEVAQRALLKMARRHVIGGYRSGYEATGAVLDRHRLAYWGAYHACCWSATLAGEIAAGTPWDGAWKPAELDRSRRAFRKDLAKRFHTMAGG